MLVLARMNLLDLLADHVEPAADPFARARRYCAELARVATRDRDPRRAHWRWDSIEGLLLERGHGFPSASLTVGERAELDAAINRAARPDDSFPLGQCYANAQRLVH